MRKSKYEEIGKNGTTEQLLQAFNKVAGSWLGSAHQKLDALTDGAAEAFHNGHPENVQTLLQNLQAVKFNHLKLMYPFYFNAQMLYKTAEKSNDRQGALDGALTNFSAPDKQKLLNQMLASAIWANLSPSFIKLLHENGASFADALPLLAVFKACTPSSIERLRSYEKIMTDKQQPAASEADAWRRQMEEQVADLTREVERLRSLVPAPVAGKPQGKRSYPQPLT